MVEIITENVNKGSYRKIAFVIVFIVSLIWHIVYGIGMDLISNVLLSLFVAVIVTVIVAIILAILTERIREGTVVFSYHHKTGKKAHYFFPQEILMWKGTWSKLFFGKNLRAEIMEIHYHAEIDVLKIITEKICVVLLLRLSVHLDGTVEKWQKFQRYVGDRGEDEYLKSILADFIEDNRDFVATLYSAMAPIAGCVDLNGKAHEVLGFVFDNFANHYTLDYSISKVAKYHETGTKMFIVL
ncbi:hypothetical protein KKA15_00005 [Patescibacteria group bacterium]|nr:hypothetical protein [Patescibacteria group bacterium]